MIAKVVACPLHNSVPASGGPADSGVKIYARTRRDDITVRVATA